MDIPELDPSELANVASQREKMRESMFLLADISFDGARASLVARVRNISAGGMMIDASVSREKGQRLIATLKNIGEVPGYVAWSTATRVGISFDYEIDPKKARQSIAATPTSGQIFTQPAPGRRPGLAIR